MTVEHRTVTDIEVRQDGAAIGRVTITPVVYGVRDSYKTWWRPGVFGEYLRSGSAPVFCWGHDQRDVVGQMVDYEDGEKSLRMNMQLDDPEAVPRAKQAMAQITPNKHTGKPTLRGVSVGFEREEWEDDDNGETHFVRCRLPEVSIVADAAVPGAQVVGVRTVEHEHVLQLARHLRAGEMSLDEAIAIVRAVGQGEERGGMHAHAKQDGSGVVRHSHASDNAAHAHSGLMPRMSMAAAMGMPMRSTEDGEERAQWDAAARKEAVDKGWAMPDGTFPIKDASDVDAAVTLWQSGHHQTDAAKAHIIKRAKAIGATDQLPEDWVDGGKDDATEADRSAEVDALIAAALGRVAERRC